MLWYLCSNVNIGCGCGQGLLTDEFIKEIESKICWYENFCVNFLVENKFLMFYYLIFIAFHKSSQDFFWFSKIQEKKIKKFFVVVLLVFSLNFSSPKISLYFPWSKSCHVPNNLLVFFFSPLVCPFLLHIYWIKVTECSWMNACMSIFIPNRLPFSQ